MTPELTNQVTAGLLILWLATVLAIGMILSLVVISYVKRNRSSGISEDTFPPEFDPAPSHSYVPSIFDVPCRWLAIRSNSIATVQMALGVQNARPCSWDEGLSEIFNDKLFISPSINGWILVVGQRLPDPTEDVDECFYFIMSLSRALGQVQMFNSNRALDHHAWVWAESGRIIRAYAWGGETCWDQGTPTAAEIELGLKCWPYGESPSVLVSTTGPHSSQSNSEKVTALAARWSLDPTSINSAMLAQNLGLAGDLRVSHKP